MIIMLRDDTTNYQKTRMIANRSSTRISVFRTRLAQLLVLVLLLLQVDDNHHKIIFNFNRFGSSTTNTNYTTSNNTNNKLQLLLNSRISYSSAIFVDLDYLISAPFDLGGTFCYILSVRAKALIYPAGLIHGTENSSTLVVGLGGSTSAGVEQFPRTNNNILEVPAEQAPCTNNIVTVVPEQALSIILTASPAEQAPCTNIVTVPAQAPSQAPPGEVSRQVGVSTVQVLAGNGATPRSSCSIRIEDHHDISNIGEAWTEVFDILRRTSPNFVPSNDDNLVVPVSHSSNSLMRLLGLLLISCFPFRFLLQTAGNRIRISPGQDVATANNPYDTIASSGSPGEEEGEPLPVAKCARGDRPGETPPQIPYVDQRQPDDGNNRALPTADRNTSTPEQSSVAIEEPVIDPSVPVTVEAKLDPNATRWLNHCESERELRERVERKKRIQRQNKKCDDKRRFWKVFVVAVFITTLFSLLSLLFGKK